MMYSPYAVMKNGTIRAMTHTTMTNGVSNVAGVNTDSSLVEPLLSSDPSQQQQQGKNMETGKAFPEPNIHFCMTLVYLEAIGLYGFIVALLLISL